MNFTKITGLTEEGFIELFKRMRDTILNADTQKFHSSRLEAYESARTNPSTENDHNRDILLDWPKVSIDELHNKLQFDGFLNDNFGATRFLVENGAYPVIKSAILNSELGACSFVSMIPGNQDLGEPLIVYTPYSGAEATGIYNLRTTELEFGLVITRWNHAFGNPIPQEYKFFGEGYIAVLDKDGAVKALAEMPLKKTLLVPFIYEQDLATKPFGRSRLSKAALSSLDAALGSMSRIETIEDIYGKLRLVLLFKGYENSMSTDKISDSLKDLLAIYNGDEQGSIDMKQFDPLLPAPIEGMVRLHAANYATTQQMNPSSFNVQPSNGSFSSDTLIIQGKPFNDLVSKCRSAYGESIKALAVLGMSLFLNDDGENDLNKLVPVYLDTFDRESIGKLGDGLQKLKELIPDSNFAASNFIRQQLGIPVRDELMDIEYPAGIQRVNLSEQAKLLKKEMFDADGNLMLDDKEVQPTTDLM